MAKAKAVVLPQQPQRASDSSLIESGEMAAEFAAAPEWEWMHGQLDAEIESRMWEKLSLSPGQADRLTALCCEIDLLNYVKTLPARARNMAEGAKKREAQRNA